MYVVIKCVEREMEMVGATEDFQEAREMMTEAFDDFHREAGFSREEVEDAMDNECFVDMKSCSSNLADNLDVRIFEI